ncbi:TauD/TfdA family dioxygenase [Pseudonocardia ailaonensis]|uniref:TauD/TfdA family dioxygenase n=1 Tax=Pseudonocardia ailaonensis TaxID=367279 RepID=A0ABN2MK21_9PSEU
MTSIEPAAPPLTFTPVTGALGAEISGVRLDADLDPGTVRTLREGLNRHRVLFFRDQSHLDDRGQTEFARLLGPVTPHPLLNGFEAADPVTRFDSLEIRANQWHTDVLFIERPPAFSVLRAVSVPTTGGDTLWADTVAAYARLPRPLRALADELWAVHSSANDYVLRGDRRSSSLAERLEEIVFSARHPVVRVHPETGERALLLGLTARRFEDLSGKEAALVHGLLQAYVENAENTVRWRWSAGDVAIWDNRATQHYAAADYDFRRVMHRVTVDGEAPLSVDGRRGVALSGDGSAFAAAG